MKTSSPLRYPGGKSCLANLLGGIRRANRLGNHSVIEPFAGGAGAALSMLFSEEAHEIVINDLDYAVYCFWWSITRRAELFIELMHSTPVSIDEWHRQRDIYRSTKVRSKLVKGFSAFYLNRCNRSGVIMNGGPIGGIRQAGQWKIDARFNKDDLEKRCRRVFEFGSRIQVSNTDAMTLIRDRDQVGAFMFLDPPYFCKGKTLYMNNLDPLYHERLSQALRSTRKATWVLTYDDCPEIRRLYSSWANLRPFTLRYAASERRRGHELLITPKSMRLPSNQSSSSIAW